MAELRKRNALIVDDDSSNLITTSKILTEEGFSITTASNFQEANASIKNNLYHLIILDVILPDGLGTDLCVESRNNSPNSDSVIMLISGKKISSDDHAFGLEIGADDYMSRPFKARELIARINSIFRVRESTPSKRQSYPFGFFSQQNTEVTASIFEQQKINISYPNEFKTLVDEYKKLLDKAIEIRVYKISSNISDQVKSFANELLFLKAHARDLIDIHTEAIKSFDNISNAKKSFLVKDESRILLLEVMGHLLNLYRLKS